MFLRALDREALIVLAVILGFKIEIKVEEGMVIMVYSIIQDYVCYNFVAYVLDKIKTNLANINNGDF